MIKYLIIAMLALTPFSAYSEETNNKYRMYDETALILNEGDFKYSLFGNAEYGINEKMSITGHPLMLFVSPSIDFKYNFYKENNLTITSMHGINYPTPLLNLIAMDGTGGVISPEFDIPHTFSIRNAVVATYQYSEKHYLTASFGFEFALNNGDLDPGTSIDLPIILPRTMVYYKNAGFDLKVIAEGKIISCFDYHLKTELFVFPFEDNKYDYEYPETSNSIFWETSGNLFCNFRETFKIGLGGKLCYGTYPFGTQWHLIPFIDFVKYIE